MGKIILTRRPSFSKQGKKRRLQNLQANRHDKETMRLFKRYEKARTAHGELMRESLATGNFNKTLPARHKMENALHDLNTHSNKKTRKKLI